MANFGTFEGLQRAVDSIKGTPLPYAEPSDIFDFAENSNIIRSLKTPSGEILGYHTPVQTTTQLVPEVSTSTATSTVNTALTVDSTGTSFEGFNVVETVEHGILGSGVLQTLSIATALNSVYSSLGVQQYYDEEIGDFDYLTMIRENPRMYEALTHVCVNDENNIPSLYDVEHDITYINENAVDLALEVLNGIYDGEKKSPDFPTSTAIPFYNIGAYNFYQGTSLDPTDISIVSDISIVGDVSAISYKDGNYQHVYVVSDHDFSGDFTYNFTRWGVTQEKTGTLSSSSYTYNGKTVYYSTLPYTQGDLATNDAPQSTITGITPNLACWLAVYGLDNYPDGFNQMSEEEATHVVNTKKYQDLSRLEKFQKLREELPTWYDNAKTTNIIDASGNITEETWLPVQLPTTGLGIATNIKDYYNTNNNQSFDGTYPDPTIEELAKLVALEGINLTISYPTPIKIPIPPTVDEPTPPIPPDPTDPVETIAKINTGTTLPPTFYGDHAHVYLPTHAQVNALMNYLWGSGTSLDSLKRLFSNPIDAIIGLQQIYFTPSVDGQAEIILGNLATGVTGVDYTETRFYEVDFGSIAVKEYFGNVLDYYTSISIYLPFVGIVPLSVDNIMRADAVNVKYNIDILTGSANVQIWVKRDNCNNILYTYGCQTASQYPLSGQTFGSQVMGIASATLGIASMVATGGASAPAVMGVLGGVASASTQPNISKSGGFMGIGGLIHKQPYMVMERVIPNMPVDYPHYFGYPYYKSSKLGNCVGFTQATDLHLDTTNMLYDDIIEIENMLNNGVIL